MKEVRSISFRAKGVGLGDDELNGNGMAEREGWGLWVLNGV